MDDEEQPIPHSQKLTASSIFHIEPENSRTSNLISHFPPRLPPNVASDSTLSQIPLCSCLCDKRSEKEVRSIHHSLNGNFGFRHETSKLSTKTTFILPSKATSQCSWKFHFFQTSTLLCSCEMRNGKEKSE